MAQWSLDDIPWHSFDASKTTPELVSLVKAASLVEFNGYEYARYLCNVFHDDQEFQALAKDWAEEEVQHGQALRKWAELADPEFNFEESFEKFTTGYQLPIDVAGSVRGSRSGELMARCVVESGTSAYYTAIGRLSEEPVLQAVCAKIAADEFRHYKLFYTYLKRYLDIENISVAKRVMIGLGRVCESEDDELAYAYYAAHRDPRAYDRKFYKKRYMGQASSVFRREDINRMSSMILKAAGLTPNGLLGKGVGKIAWTTLQWRAQAA